MKKVSFRIFAFLLLFGFCVKAQITESEKLLVQAEEIVFQNPHESYKIANYLLKQANSEDEKSKAYYISAYSQFVLGNLDQALSDAFSAKKLATEDSEIYQKNQEIIDEILKGLELRTSEIQAEKWNPNLKIAKLNEMYRTGSKYISNHDLINAEKQLNLLKTEQKNLDHQKALEYLLLGEIYFEKKQHDSALFYGKEVQKFAEFTQNPFLIYESSVQLAKNYLALNQMEEYQTQSQKAKESSIQTHKIETNAANMAHELIIEDVNENLAKKEKNYSNWILIILGFILAAAVVKLFLFLRNRSKIKTYTMLANYLKKQEEQHLAKLNSIEAELEEELEEVLVENEKLGDILKPKPIQIQKESEKQILQGLRKFEASQKFTNKDMSLGMLAAQLNTNTKYLSEIINRQKNKNFSSYINELRINYITEKLRNEPHYLNYKVSYLAEECGFSSHSTFTTVFKSVVGVSPVIFLELIKEDNAVSSSNKLEHV